MKIEKLVGNYYINENIIKKVSELNDEIISGVYFDFNNYNGSILDFIQNNFCYFKSGNYLTHELLFFNYFFNEQDIVEIKIRNLENKVLFEIKDTCFNLFLGHQRTNFLSLGWIFSQNSKGLKIYIKKEQSHNFIEEIDFIDEHYLEFLLKEVIHSNSLKDDNFKLSIYHFSGTFVEQLDSFRSKFKEFTKYTEVSNRIDQGIEKFKKTHDLFYIFNCIGVNKKNFWKEDFLTK